MSRRSVIGLTAGAGLVVIASVPLLIQLAPHYSSLSTVGLASGARDLSPVVNPVRLPLPGHVVVRQGTVHTGDGPAVSRSSNRAVRLVIDDAVIEAGLPSAAIEAASTASLVSQPIGIGDDAASYAPLLDALSQGAFETLEIRRGVIRVMSDGRRGYDLENVNLTLAMKGQSVVVLGGSMDRSGRSVRIDATLGRVAEKSTPTTGRSLKLAVKGAGIEATVDGRLSLDNDVVLDGPVELSADKVRKLAALVGLDLPADVAPQNLKIRGVLRGTSRGITFDNATFAVDGNVATGAISLALSGERPALLGTLAFDTLDLTKLSANVLASLWFSAGPVGPVDESSSLMRQLDADVRVSANQLTIGKLALGGAAATLVLKAGKLLADVAEIEVASGKATGQIAIDVTAPATRVVLRAKASDVDIAALIGPNLARLSLDGRANVVVDWHATGNSANALVRSLGGKLHFAMPLGGRMAVDGRAAVALAQRQDIYGWTAPLRASTAFDHLEFRLVGNDGALRVESAKIRHGDAVVIGEGHISTRTEHVELRLLANLGEPAARGVGAAASAVVASGMAATVSGPWWSPSIRVLKQTARPVLDAGAMPHAGPEARPTAVTPRDPG